MPSSRTAEPGTVRPIPSKRLEKQIREAALQYDWDRYSPADLIDPDACATTSAAAASDDPLLRIVLLCRARSPQWEKFFQKAITYADLQRYHERRPRFIKSDNPRAAATRASILAEMSSRLVNPLTLQPVDITGMGPITLAREVAEGGIQLDYVTPGTGAFRERI